MLKNKIEYMAFLLMAALLKALPLDFASALSGQLWQMFAPFNKRHKRAELHLQRALPELNQQQRKDILKGMWNNLGRVTAEGFHLNVFLREPERIELPENIEKLAQKITQHQKGAVFVSLHMGNWEIVAAPAHALGLKVAGIYQKLRNPYVENDLKQTRLPIYQGGLFHKSPGAVRKILEHLQQGNCLGILCDVRDARGISIDFFGQSAPTTPLPATLALKTGAMLITCRTVRKKDSTFLYEFQEIPTGDLENTKDNVQSLTEQIQHQFEQWIRQNPEQWMWGHRRWG